MWQVKPCKGLRGCSNPPYYPQPKSDYVSSYGKTYYDANYRGGAAREQYFQTCIPIFRVENNWSCDFYVINENNLAVVHFGEDRPKEFPECCTFGSPFRAQPRDFPSKMNYTGIEEYPDGTKYHNLIADVPHSGG